MMYANTLRGQQVFMNVDSLIGQSKIFLADKIILGELHGVTGNYKAYESIIYSLEIEKTYKLIIERGLSFSYLINEYLTGSDTTIIDKINFENEFEKMFYKSIYLKNKKLPSKNKIITIGIDLEYQDKFNQTLVALEYYLPKTNFKISYNQMTIISSDKEKSTKTKVLDFIALIDTTKFEKSKFDSLVKNIIANFQNTLKISDASYLTWGRHREKYLLENFLNRVTDVKYFLFIIGVAHLPDNYLYPAFTKQLHKNVTKEFQFIYPIYFNHVSNEYIDKKYYCEHRNDPIKFNKTLFNYFDKKKGSWLMTYKNVNYLIISN